MGFPAVPLRFAPNRVWRTYTGGALLDAWAGAPEPRDAHFPEEWIASAVAARNPADVAVPGEGLSWVDDPGAGPGGKTRFADLLTRAPEALLGRAHVRAFGATPARLAKMLDSAERLTLQVHPDKADAARLFQSPYGKTEAWLIVGARTVAGVPPYLLLGFKPGITRRHWEGLFEAQDVGGMLECLHKVPVRAGEVYLIPGGLPHAIGPGCFLLEIQEPTDLTIRVERTTPGGLTIPDPLLHQGIGFAKMFDCFHYDGLTEDQLRASCCLAAPEAGTGDTELPLIGPQHTPCFGLHRLEVSRRLTLEDPGRFSSLAVLSGGARLEYAGGELPVRQGDLLGLPAALGKVTLVSDGPAPCIAARCLPPLPNAS